VSAIYNARSGAQDAASCGETKILQASQPAEKIKLWATNPRNPTRRNPHRNNPRPAAPARKKAQPWPPSPLPRKSNRPLTAVSPDLKIRRDRFLPKIFPVRIMPTMKLCQGQVWKKDKEYIRIVRLERLEVEYKSMPNLGNKEGTKIVTSKKDFCRLLKGAHLLQPTSAKVND
jgi:hypothetical protein